MRTNQVGVRVYRYGNQVAKGYQVSEAAKKYMYLSRDKEIDEEKTQVISVYADANDFYEAICAAFNEAMLVVIHYDKMEKCEGDETFESGGYNIVKFSFEHFNLDYTYFNERFKESVTAESTNVYEALVMAFYEVLEEAQKYANLPQYGARNSFYCGTGAS